MNIDVKETGDGRSYFYDIDKIREVGYQDENEFYPVRSLSTSLTQYSLPQNGETVNSNDMQNFENDTGNDWQNAMPVSGTEADVDNEGIIAPREMIAQIPKTKTQ